MNGGKIMIDVDKIDLAIMGVMVNKDKTSPLFSIQIKDIMDSLKFKYEISYSTMLRRIKKLIEKGYVGEGYTLGNSRHVYLLGKGIVLLQNIQEAEDVYIEVADYNENNNELEELDNE
jgi:transketolase C-terminal domain/subunit